METPNKRKYGAFYGRDGKKLYLEIAQAEKRIAELDRIFKRIYKDDISGTISHGLFLKLSA